MANDRHTMFFMGKEYPNVAMGGGSGGGGDTPSDEGIILFDGTWKNQNILGITPYLATIENGELHCQGLHCGVVVSDVSGMTSDYNPYQLIITGYSQGFGLQAGRCNPTNDLNGIIQYGTDRLSYTNDTIPLGNFKIRINALNNLQGVFLGGAYTVASTDFTITKILLSRQNTEKTYS